MLQAAFLVLILMGTVALISGMMWTRLHWRTDVPAYGRESSALDVTLHPERYATPDAVGVIRLLFRTGLLLVGIAVVIIGYELAESTFKR